MSRQQSEVLREARSHFRTMQSYAQRDLDDQMVVDAICMRLSAGIEALAVLDRVPRDDLFRDDWALMWGMRNRIAHGYLLVDVTIIRRTLERDIPTIMARIEEALNGSRPSGDRPGDDLDAGSGSAAP